MRPIEGAPRDLTNKLGELLGEWTGRRWVVSVSGEPGEPTLEEQAEARAAIVKSEAARHPLVRAVLEAFPGARIEACARPWRRRPSRCPSRRAAGRRGRL